MRLEQENDDLAHELVTSKIALRKDLDNDVQRQKGTGISSTGEATPHLVCLLGEVRGRVQVLMFCHSCSVPT
ncbi:hypothetical protein DV515_00013318 [Chloebia gouldiae]|uniref:Uncharacterized protein n=1 Tax=Chloebia gouldiae TaxID=44316 RepID=A0A3L8S1S0_CHLGU|nr:hypothetical protein DV515_00013318 [Chloebia gouldiae]